MSDDNVNVVNCDEVSQSSASSFAVPGVSEFAPPPSNNQSPPSWTRGATKEDYNYMQRKSLCFSLSGSLILVFLIQLVDYQDLINLL